MTRFAGTIAWRVILANHRRFDADVLLEDTAAALAEARRQAQQTAAELDAIRSSTSWALTAPLRWLLARNQPEQPPAPPAETPAPDHEPEHLRYQRWIVSQEPLVTRRLLSAGRGAKPAVSPKVALIIGQEASASPWPEGCEVLQAPAGADPAAMLDLARRRVPDGWVCFHDASNTIAADALRLVSQELSRFPDTHVLYGDEDRIDRAGNRSDPVFKPSWDPDFHHACDLLGPFTFINTELLDQVQPGDGPHWRFSLAAQAATCARPDRIRHVPAVLLHRTQEASAPAPAQDAVAQQLGREGIVAEVSPVPGAPGTLRIVTPSGNPRVSLIVPTRDRADLLGPCTEGLLSRTDYGGPIELLILDNGSADAEALHLLDRLQRNERVRVIRIDEPFNWSALNNRGAREATGDVLVLLNNDIMVLQPEWLEELVAQAVRPGVGAAGPMLLYPDGTVQHAGLTTDASATPRHLFRHANPAQPGPSGLLAAVRTVWGVTGACLAIRRELFFAVGGLNEALPVSCNDVDLCMRLTAFGSRIVWTPWSVVQHREFGSRAPDHSVARRELAAEELERLRRDWGALLAYDPFLNPNYELHRENPRLIIDCDP